MTSDPIRLLEDPAAASGLRGDLLHATEAKVQGINFAAGLAQLQAATSTAAASSAGLSTMAKAGLGAALAASAVALWLGMGPADSPPEPEPPAMALQTPLGSGISSTKLDEPQAEPQPQGSAQSAEIPVAPEPAPEPASAIDEPTPSTMLAEPPVRRRRTSKASKAERSAPTVDDSALREALMVAKARSSLTANPARALSLTETAERDFPYGQLIEERRAIAIRALIALGRRDEARRRADSFLARYGRGAHVAAVRRALNDTP